MDKGLITLIIVVGIALLVFVLIVLWVFWSDITAFYRWSKQKSMLMMLTGYIKAYRSAKNHPF